MTAVQTLRSVRFPDDTVIEGLNLNVVEVDQFVDNDSGELVVDCLVQHDLFSEPYPMRVEARRIEFLR